MSTSVASSPITFYRFRKDGSPNPDIRRCFLSSFLLSAEDAIIGKLWLEDKSEWTLVLEQPVREALKSAASCECIISFQVRHSGAYAVARLDTKTQTQTGEAS